MKDFFKIFPWYTVVFFWPFWIIGFCAGCAANMFHGGFGWYTEKADAKFNEAIEQLTA